METILDNCHEILLEGLAYDGKSLTATVSEISLGNRKVLVSKTDARKFKIIFFEPITFCLLEELWAVTSNLISGSGKIIRDSEPSKSVNALGVNQIVEANDNNLRQYNLITAHEVLLVLSSNPPLIAEIKLGSEE